MSGITALLLYAAWTMAVMLAYVNWRTVMVLQGHPANSWTRGTATDVPGWVRRAEHAHANCVENLPIVAAVVLSAYVLGKAGVVDGLMTWVLLARLAQSAVHIASVSPAMVQVRAAFFVVQVALVGWMIFRLVA